MGYAVLFALGQAFDQFHYPSANFRVLDPHERQTELQPLAARKKLDDGGSTISRDNTGTVCKLLDHALVKVSDRNAKYMRNLIQPAGAYSIDALLVFLDLLEGQTKKFAEFFLTHANQHSAKADPIADLSIDWVGLFLGHGATYGNCRFCVRP